MTKSKQVVRKQLKQVKSDSRANRLLRFFHATGLFRWERPSTHGEEVLNILTHGIGVGLAIAALTLLVVFAALAHNPWAVVSCAIFGATMIMLYFGSTMCHATIHFGCCFGFRIFIIAPKITIAHNMPNTVHPNPPRKLTNKNGVYVPAISA